MVLRGHFCYSTWEEGFSTSYTDLVTLGSIEPSSLDIIMINSIDYRLEFRNFWVVPPKWSILRAHGHCHCIWRVENCPLKNFQPFGLLCGRELNDFSILLVFFQVVAHCELNFLFFRLFSIKTVVATRSRTSPLGLACQEQSGSTFADSGSPL